MMPSVASVPSQDMARRQLQSASEWFRALETRSRLLSQKLQAPPTALALPPAGPGLISASQAPASIQFRRPLLEHDDLQLTLHDLCARCPACFGRLGDVDDHQLEQAKEYFESLSSQLGPATGCGSQVKAAIDNMVKTTLGPFDTGGVMGMTCRHGAPLLFADVKESGEAHYFAYALLDHVITACGPTLRTLGVCYDISCKIDVSPRMKKAFDQRPLQIHYAVSLFHVYGHDYTCQLKYSPRRMAGFGLTDGESLERLWSALTDLVSLTRGMMAVRRRETLCARLAKLSTQHQSSSIMLLAKRLQKVAALFQKEVDKVLELHPSIVDIKMALEQIGPLQSTTTSLNPTPAASSSSQSAFTPAEVPKDCDFFRRIGLPEELVGIAVYLHTQPLADDALANGASGRALSITAAAGSDWSSFGGQSTATATFGGASSSWSTAAAASDRFASGGGPSSVIAAAAASGGFASTAAAATSGGFASGGGRSSVTAAAASAADHALQQARQRQTAASDHLSEQAQALHLPLS
ncbi:unnamed protein product, partial [Tilletia laevis]